MGAESTMRENHELRRDALRRRMWPPMEWAMAIYGGWQSGSTISFMKAARSRSKSAKERTCPFQGLASSRSDPPCPRQSMVATANPRRRRSAITSKYFSMNSPRPWKRQTVPRDRSARRLPAGKPQFQPVALESARDGSARNRVLRQCYKVHARPPAAPISPERCIASFRQRDSRAACDAKTKNPGVAAEAFLRCSDALCGISIRDATTADRDRRIRRRRATGGRSADERHRNRAPGD